uniref:ARAD1D46618p n=1 Tax=Blastobotrys adeninivorans TaxID=409370 RepID=A0A060TDT4_BLAAD
MATPAQQLVEGMRRNNVELLESVLKEAGSAEAKAKLINEAQDGTGNYALHVGATNGSYEAIDLVLDQEGVEVDPVNRLDGETPLHTVVRYSIQEPEHGAFLAEVLIDAGADPRIRNKHNQKPIDLVDKRENEKLVEILQGAEYAMMLGPGDEEVNGPEDDGSGSESD